MNHNLETIPRLYKEARLGADYQFSLNLLKKFKAALPNIPTKSGLMVGLGETDDEILDVMRDMRQHGIEMLTIGQYLASSSSHLNVKRYVRPDTFKMFESKAYAMGFRHAAVGAMVPTATGSHTTMHCGPNWTAYGSSTARCFYGKRIPSPACCRGSSRASCQTSISVRIQASPAIPPSWPQS